tara:strand:- start:504 stop:1700 length:1197 start_codon:yes stop_codon:yes gene_type:complete
MKNYAAVFGLGPYQIYGIKRLSKKYKLIGFDKDNKTPGIKYVEKFYNLDKIDKFKILKICKNKRINKFFCFSSDFSVKLINFLNQKLDIKNPNKRAELISTNKFLFRKTLKNKKILSPFFKQIELKKIKDLNLNENSKYICKPLSSSGSRGVFIFKNKKQLIQNLKKYKEEYQNQNKILVEELLEGQMYSIEGFYFNNSFLPICINKNFKELKYSLANKSILINFKNTKVFNEGKNLVTKCCKALNVKYAPIHFEFIISNKTKKIYPIEIALRGAGTFIYGTYLSKILKKNTADLEIDLKEKKEILKVKNNFSKLIYLHFINIRKTTIFYKLNKKLLKRKLNIPFNLKILKRSNKKINLRNSADDRVAIAIFEFKNYVHFKKYYYKINRIFKKNNFIN